MISLRPCQFLQFPMWVHFIQNGCACHPSHWDFAMTPPPETALTFVVVKSLAIVGSAFAAVLFLAIVGAKRG